MNVRSTMQCPTIRGGHHQAVSGAGAFSLIEVLVAVAVLGITFFAFYAGISAGFLSIQVTRENLRATQILQEKMETIRLYNWDQVNSNGFIPTSFSAPFYALDGTSETNNLTYFGTLAVSQPEMNTTYSNDLRLVTVQVRWSSGGRGHSRSMSTYVSRYGLQNYIY